MGRRTDMELRRRLGASVMAPRECPAQSLLRRGGGEVEGGLHRVAPPGHLQPAAQTRRGYQAVPTVPGEDASGRAAQCCHGATKPHLQHHPSLVLLDLGSISAAGEAVAVGLCTARLLVRPWCERSLGSPRSVWRCPRRPNTPPLGRETPASRPAARCLLSGKLGSPRALASPLASRPSGPSP